MSGKAAISNVSASRILEATKQYWGFDALRPLQQDAIRAGLEHRDSLVVMPTGGGKSLCYQVPPLLAERMDVVVSPLISLMKDQVDGLVQCGYPAAALHSGMSLREMRDVENGVASGDLRLLFVAPERLMTSRFLDLLSRANADKRHTGVRAFSIDEAHCISHWGHDFRPHYRQLVGLRDRFPTASVHAYTATATPRVREDIVAQLQLRDPHVLIGTFDRPNLIFRIVQRIDLYGQVLEVVKRHERQATIVYCISRKDTEEMSEWLASHKIRAAYYHAGMEPDSRRRTQEAFADEKLDVIVATVAFGMGIDRSDVRCVIHAAMPKSIEHYQQETGRAGRDGLEAECVLLYSAADAMRWESLIEKSAEEAEKSEEVIEASKELLRHMQRYAGGAKCRHRSLSEYFGQAYAPPDCGACDVCLDEAETIPDASVMAQKILSCIARVDQRFGVGHVVDVLMGANTEMVRSCRHEQLSVYGLLKDLGKKELTNLVYQLVDQGVAERTGGDRPIIKLNDASWRVMRGQDHVRLLRPKSVKKTKVAEDSWEGVDQGMFEDLRSLRAQIAGKQNVPAYIVFGDVTLRELARVRPDTLDGFGQIRGIGAQKKTGYGPAFVERIVQYCRAHKLEMNQDSDQPAPGPAKPLSASLRKAFALFSKGASVENVMAELGRARSTTMEYLVEYIERERPPQIDRWVDRETYGLVQHVAREMGTTPLRPIFERLEEKVPYDQIRLVTRHMELRM
jgi:ATP-dependent DNA helicase RecQ